MLVVPEKLTLLVRERERTGIVSIGQRLTITRVIGHATEGTVLVPWSNLTLAHLAVLCTICCKYVQRLQAGMGPGPTLRKR